MRVRTYALMCTPALACLVTVFGVLDFSGRNIVSAAAGRAAASNAVSTFDFKDPKGVNAIGFFVDSELEPIAGYASGLSGTIQYDPADPTSFRGALEIDAGKINTSNSRMTDVMQGADWIDLGNHLKVVFTFDEVVSARPAGDGATTLEVKGRLSIRGVKQDLTVTVKATHLPDAASRRGGARAGDLLVLRSNFTIDRTKFNIKPQGGFDKVGRDIQLNVAIAGYEQ